MVNDNLFTHKLKKGNYDNYEIDWYEVFCNGIWVRDVDTEEQAKDLCDRLHQAVISWYRLI